jgi:hypothetical protein
MKKTNILYWTFTSLFAALMVSTAIPDILLSADAIKFTTDLLGYPKYILPFIGVAKVLGGIAILIPGFQKIKEWAYAGLMIDLVGALYSQIAVGGVKPELAFMLVFIGLGAASYYFFNKISFSFSSLSLFSKSTGF